ncbi:hypothetical protein E0Z10_g10408 [Xylaria hypoxylon]|uniref:AAA+ ATPase domain-containing protein n=1 Tax=Xylaria hypoxylon TaxID=37992 RepID=A0A4Z0YL32_9PEZI|nr:hypothetical protein E0Z10_g10408 [Xylaria hypoxylon]
MAETGDGTEVQLKKLHPFFSAPNIVSKTVDAVTPPTPDPSCSPASSDESRNDPVEHDNHHHEPSERKRKRRKTDPSSSTSETLPGAPRTKRRTRVSTGPSIAKHFGQDNAKGKQVHIEQTRDGERMQELFDDGTNPIYTQASEYVVETNDDALQDKENRRVPESTCTQKSQKLLKLNPATGTIGSPPRPKPSTSGKRRGRKPKALIITISYGTDAASREQVGQRINQVLLGTLRIPSFALTNPTSNTPPPSQGNINDNALGTTRQKCILQKAMLPQRPGHPFFQAKNKGASVEDGQKAAKIDKVSSKRQVIFTSTPYSPRQARPMPSNLSLPPIGSKGSIKIPGVQYPSWPWRDAVHIRDNSSLHFVDSANLESILGSSRGRKAKGQATHIGRHESILYEAASKLGIRELANDVKSTKDQDFRPIASMVRIPLKHFESGRKLQARVFKELHTLTNNGALSKTHPAVLRAYKSISTTLSAFDASTCESVAWAQKYAPTSAQCVLQKGPEAELLRDWLQSLKVQAVDTGASDNTPKPQNGSVPKKKRRQQKKLEGFVVSSDEEANEIDGISDSEPQWFIHGAKKTVMRCGDGVDRAGKPGSRLANAVLLSGPHGCGKTATVYAIAEELNFEVFEINAGARRSGKDILERVGDMTRNHLVHHQQKDEPQGSSTNDDEVAKNLKSGKQGMMTSFFKPKPSQQIKEAHKVNQTPEAPVPASQGKKLNRDQKQSLILLEEVDVLYEEDKQFWATVISMIAQSKRPFIMTCNNESIIPLQSLKLHGIFRFCSPPTDLAVDMLLLIAANEGHALRRHAVDALYESRGHDLRGAITELNYWCQIGVGDLRGGFDWFYPRWPKGSDVDEEGQTIRVVSQGTYHAGMGWLNRDLATTESSPPSIVPDLHREAWDHWGLDVSDHHEFEDPSSWVKKTTEQASSRTTRLALLQSIEAFADSISESDLCGPFLSPLSNHIALDATVPDLHTKTLDDFTVGNKVLQVTPLCDYNSISLEVSTSLKILAQLKLVRGPSPSENGCPISRFDEKRVTGDIEHHLKMSSRSEGPITRKDYSIAFDPIAASEKILTNNYLDPSVFDREMSALCLDVAPYIRGIISYEQRLQNERRTRSSLLSEGGNPEKKRMRTTRAALSALDGGSRATTRRERYFAANINPYLVMRTGGKCWGELVRQIDESEEHIPLAAHENPDMYMDATLDRS